MLSRNESVLKGGWRTPRQAVQTGSEAEALVEAFGSFLSMLDASMAFGGAPWRSKRKLYKMACQ